MCEYDAFADLLNKFSQLTPWIQASVIATFPLSILALGTCLRGTIKPTKQQEEK